MKSLNTAVKRMALIAGFVWIAHGTQPASAQTNGAIYIKAIVGVVEILPHGTTNWYRAADGSQLHTSDRVRARAHSSAALILTTGQGESVVRLKAMSEVEILPDTSADGPGLDLIGGILSFFHRDKPSRVRVISDGGNAGILGTEFVMAVTSVNGTEQTTLSVIDGQVYFTNAGVTLDFTNDQQGIGEPGRPPRRTAGFIANNILQWCFYYPGVLDANELPLTAAETNELAESLVAYRAGDLLVALAKYPDARQPGSDAERVYHAALVLSVGQVEEAETNLSAMSATGVAEKNQRLAAALRTLIAAVKREPRPSTVSYSPRWSEAKTNQLSSEFLADSYYEQSLGGPKALDNALQLARRAAASSPNFGFARERVAELEFSFGKTDRALADLKTALQLSPRNAQALALQGFLLAAQNKTREAIASFNAALAVDSGLGNAWLGRGLCRIKRGDGKAGREDLLIAAAMEPQRAALRSYLGKAFGDAGDTRRATNELRLAKQLDTNDPTAWLYSALLNEQNNRINEAVRDLEKSQELNNNRSVYRSDLLLDQDRAVRSANLARIYDEAGLDDVALREASRAMSADYANYSAHLFLANSYEQLRASSPFDLRYETPAFSEYLIASLLGPPDGRMLAQPVSQQEYTRLFDKDSFGVASDTEYLGRGAVSQYMAQYGTLRNSSYAFESQYNWDPGQTPNGSEQTEQYSLKVKQMLTRDDGLFFEILDFHRDTGDVSQQYNPDLANLGFKSHERQAPSVLVGLDHRWSETQHTLFLASIFNDTVSFVDPDSSAYFFGLKAVMPSPPFQFEAFSLTEHFQNRLQVESYELQHLATLGPFQTIAGIRLQNSDNHFSDEQSMSRQNVRSLSFLDLLRFFDTLHVPGVLGTQTLQASSLRVTPYLYEYWHPTPQLCLIGGLSYDYQSLPENALFAPLDNQEKIQRQLSPKAGLVWSPFAHTTLRGAYSQSLGGANLDQSVRLEPTQLAGFTQAYRNVMPDSLVGGIGGARFETADVSLEQRFDTGTFLAVSAELLHSTANHGVGAFVFRSDGVVYNPVQEANDLTFQERSLDFSAHQLLGDYFSVGVRYRLTDARLVSTFPEIGYFLGPVRRSEMEGQLRVATFDAAFQYPCGLFADVEAQSWNQALSADVAALSGDSFWQVNAEIGYRSPRRHVQVSVGLLNLTGQNYHLFPINLYPDLPRQSMFVTRLQLNF
jgi:Tfp pilus assembly protein PilF